MNYEQYTYEKVANEYGDDIIFKIENRYFLCLGLEKFNSTSKINGLGFLNMSIFKEKVEHLKIINMLKVLNMEKRGEKFDYFKTKMKGLTKPVKIINRKYDF